MNSLVLLVAQIRTHTYTSPNTTKGKIAKGKLKIEF